MRFGRFLILTLGLLAVYAAGLGIRRVVLEAQQETIGEDMPFTLESALHYRRIKMLFDRGFLPEVDPAIQYPEGIRIREIDSVASEPVQAFLVGWFPADMDFHDRLRWIEAGWFCLSMPLMAWLLRLWTGSWPAGWLAALLYAVSLASVLRSTGQEISRENFAMPFLVFAMACAAGALREDRARRRVYWSIGASAGLGLALVGWDMIQFVVGILALGMSIHLLVRGGRHDRKLLELYGYLFAGALAVAIMHPYYRFHGLAFSPLMAWLAGILAAAWWSGRSADASTEARVPDDAGDSSTSLRCARDDQKSRITDLARPRVILSLILFGPPVLMLIAGRTGAYGESYGHFAELILAKLRFMNIKPEDPSQLTFYQRIMWVPSLHSATWELTTWLFPFTLWLSLLVAPAAWRDSLKRPDPLVYHLLLLFGISLAAYVMFVRFHVFVALASALLAGWAMGRVRGAAIEWKAALVLIMSFAVMAEAGHTLREKSRMGRPNVYYSELKELAEYVREHIAPEAVLANMGVSAYVAAYGKCPVAIHPKFEDPSIRRRLERYGELMFGADEKDLRDWMDELDTPVLVYAKGEFAGEKPEYQMRYFVNRMNPPGNVPARRFEEEDESLRYFTRLWGNRKYVVYKALSADEEREAENFATAAMSSLHEGSLDHAEKMATHALALDRHQPMALKVMRHVGSLRDQGFQGGKEKAGAVEGP